ncbi:MAG: SDR family oxidoreductase [Magnetococcales bacterium]|nr:SDR family oxidoreductase [Magnetococcales bacterium]
MKTVKDMFDLTGKVTIITGGAGMLGQKHAEAIAEFGGIPVIVDINQGVCEEVATKIANKFGVSSLGLSCDITKQNMVEKLHDRVLEEFGRVDILINNAANNPKVGAMGLDGVNDSRIEAFPLEAWNQDIAVGLTGSFLCARTFGATMANNGGGVILNISSDLSLISPDQRLYRKDGLPEHAQPVKPVTYSVVKSGLIGLTRYLSTYWVAQGVRCNALSPGGVYVDQDEQFVKNLSQLIPMGRMANKDEYKAAIVFLVSDASSYMNGTNMVLDGGRTVL